MITHCDDNDGGDKGDYEKSTAIMVMTMMTKLIIYKNDEDD